MHRDSNRNGDASSQQLEEVIAAILASNNYKHICPDLIRTVTSQEMMKRRSYKETLKAVKNKLHQVGGAYLDGRDDFMGWLLMLQNAVETGKQDAIRECCKHIMWHHASTRERLPILDQFYETLFTDIGPIHSILDLACGLHPLALSWLPLAPDATYYAYDIYQHIMDFLHEWFTIMHIEDHTGVCDLSQSCPTHQVDVAFVLKTLPCLEQIDKAASLRLLRIVNARYVIVSFPIQSLGGKAKGMATYYEAHFTKLIEHEPWSVRKVEFSTELVFVVQKEQ
jgi:16S rRNA (guanine(1405)-N(7))-methyltransferase